MRGRGLKLPSELVITRLPTVAPHAGAWIETSIFTFLLSDFFVAPHAGAWIETML